MLQDFEFDHDNFHDMSWAQAFGLVLLVMYLVLMSVLLLNTLIASMNDTYSRIVSQAEGYWRLEQARIIRALEHEMDWKQRMDQNHAYWTVIHGRAQLQMEVPVDEYRSRQQAREESIGRNLAAYRSEAISLDQMHEKNDEEAGVARTGRQRVIPPASLGGFTALELRRVSAQAEMRSASKSASESTERAVRAGRGRGRGAEGGGASNGDAGVMTSARRGLVGAVVARDGARAGSQDGLRASARGKQVAWEADSEDEGGEADNEEEEEYVQEIAQEEEESSGSDGAGSGEGDAEGQDGEIEHAGEAKQAGRRPTRRAAGSGRGCGSGSGSGSGSGRGRGRGRTAAARSTNPRPSSRGRTNKPAAETPRRRSRRLSKRNGV